MNELINIPERICQTKFTDFRFEEVSIYVRLKAATCVR